MKKKFISALLFGALVASSTSTLVSCKDYDDDINSLKTEITTNASTLNELVTEKVNNLNTEINALKAQQEKLNSALETAKSSLDAAIKKAEADANAYAEVQAAAAQKAAIEAAKASLDSQVAILQTAIDKANASIDAVNNKVTNNSDQIAKLLQADTDLQNAINTVKGSLETSINTVKEAAATAQAAADKAQGSADDAAKAAQENADAIKNVANNLDTIQKTLQNQITVLGDKLDNAVTEIAKNKADFDDQLVQVNAAIKANTDLINAIKDANDKEHTDLLKRITDNTEECTRLAGLIANAQTQCSENLKAAYAYADSKAAEVTAALTGQINEVKGTLAGAITRIDAAEKVISDLQQKYNDLVKADGDASEEIKKLQNKLQETNKTVSDNMTTLTQSIAAVNGRLDTVKNDLGDKIETVDGKADANSIKIGDLQKAAGLLSDRISDNEKAIKAIEDAIAGLDKDIKANATALENFKAEINNTLSQKITDLDNNLRNELTTEVGKLNSTISTLATKDELAQVKQDLLDQIALITGDKGVVETINGSLRALQANFAEDGIVTTVQNDLKNLTADYNNEVSQIYQELAQNSAMISQTYNALKLALDEAICNSEKKLKSLVFSPNLYNQGIEAIGVYSFNYKALTGMEATPNLDRDYTQYSKQEDKARFTAAPYETNVAPLVEASYYLNPSNALVDLDKSHYSFILNNAAVTRSISSSDVNVDSVKADDNVKGKINVFFNVKHIPNISDINNGSVDVAALRYTSKDTTIVSDFAAITRFNVSNFVINKGLGENDHAHLALSAAAAIGNTSAPTLSVVYDDAVGIDLDKAINVHYDINGRADERWGDQSTISKHNFELKYDLVGFISGSNNTNESRHAKISAGSDGRNHILTPQGYDNEVGRQIIGRTPLVRVMLLDKTNNNSVVTVGYIKVIITDHAPVIKPSLTQDLPAFNNGYTVKCTGDNAFSGKYTWAQIENELLAKLNLSKAEFDAQYSYEPTEQYKQNTNGTFTALNAASRIGTVTEVTNAGDQNTHVLQWDITESQAYTQLITNTKNTLSTYVRFKHNVDTEKDVYVKLTWNVASKNSTPTASIQDNATHKVYADWHADGSREAGWKELHIQVGNATDPNARCEFDNLVIDRTFNKLPYDIVKGDIQGTYASLANNLTVTYQFAPAAQQNNPCFSGYQVSVKNSNSQLYVKNPRTNNDVLFATLDATNGKVTLNNHSFVKEILNRYDYVAGNTAEALTFKVSINATTCAPMSNVTVNNNTFNVRVIKPMFLQGGSIKDMNLNNFSTLTQDLKLDFIDFNGYSQAQFYANSNSTKMFKDFYNITSIEQNGDITTDYKGNGYEPVDNNIFTVQFTPAIGAADANGVVNTWGSVKLTQVNMSRANSFRVIVPVKVTYKWGTLTTNVTFNVEAASGTGSKKH